MSTRAFAHELNLYHELTVRRQVTRDGKSDYYFINGTRCRRRDVVDVFWARDWVAGRVLAVIR